MAQMWVTDCSRWLYDDKFWRENEPRHDKTNKMSVRQAKTQISLAIRPVWSDSSLCTHWVAKYQTLLHADSEYSDQTGQMPSWSESSLGAYAVLLVLTCRGSDIGVCDKYGMDVSTQIVIKDVVL